MFMYIYIHTDIYIYEYTYIYICIYKYISYRSLRSLAPSLAKHIHMLVRHVRLHVFFVSLTSATKPFYFVSFTSAAKTCVQVFSNCTHTHTSLETAHTHTHTHTQGETHPHTHTHTHTHTHLHTQYHTCDMAHELIHVTGKRRENLRNWVESHGKFISSYVCNVANLLIHVTNKYMK